MTNQMSSYRIETNLAKDGEGKEVRVFPAKRRSGRCELRWRNTEGSSRSPGAETERQVGVGVSPRYGFECGTRGGPNSGGTAESLFSP